ncbi:MAG: hypothetical protein ABI686_02835 [Acidobacteriota bacterium]
MTKKLFSLIFTVLMLSAFAHAQTAEVTVTLNEQFFDVLLDALFKNFNPPEFPLAANSPKSKVQNPKSENRLSGLSSGFQENDLEIRKSKSKIRNCNESIRLQREIDGVRTAVRFRDGKIYAPIAFSGSYNPPLVGCVDFQGWAETNIDLEFDRQSQKLVGKIHVLNVQLSGTGGIGSRFVTGLVQSSIDKKVNPIEILQADKLSFLVPVQNANGSLQMKSVGVRTELGNGVLNVFIAYQFTKGK